MSELKNNIKEKFERIFGKNAAVFAENELASRDVLNIPCDIIRPNRSQPRADFCEDELLRLATSIKRYGIIQPLAVRKADIDDIYDYELISGERRLRAARLVGLYCVPCVVLDADEQTSAELAIIENIMRSDLNMFEVAYALRNLSEDFELTQEEIARKMSMSQSAVANKMRLLHLTYEEQQAILLNSLSERHARALLRLKEDRLSAIRHISDFHLNVKETEAYIESLLGQAEKNQNFNEAEIKNEDKNMAVVIKGIQKRLESLSRSGKNANMEVEFFDDRVEMHIRIDRDKNI